MEVNTKETAVSWMLLPLGTKKKESRGRGQEEIATFFQKSLVGPFDPLNHMNIRNFEKIKTKFENNFFSTVVSDTHDQRTILTLLANDRLLIELYCLTSTQYLISLAYLFFA